MENLATSNELTLVFAFISIYFIVITVLALRPLIKKVDKLQASLDLLLRAENKNESQK